MIQPYVLLQDGSSAESRWLRFVEPFRILQATTLEQVLPTLEEVERAVDAGAWAAGFLAYEAAPAFESRLATHAPRPGLPLTWWGLFDQPRAGQLPPPAAPQRLDWRPQLDAAGHRAAVESIQAAIARGETYQANFTFPWSVPFVGDSAALFGQLWRAQRPAFAALIELGELAILSLSPELFFLREGDRLVARPMKGTSRRGRFIAADDRALENLLSEKNRAENLMIVDMVRNDLGRIAAPGSVRVEKLFEAQKLPTVWQLVSEVRAQSSASLVEILRVLFPSASITGAPKISTMSILQALEETPRGVYTGAVGFLAPDRRAQLNVAIRTVTVDRTLGQASYGSGGGIVWDSEPAAEYREALDKAAFLVADRPDFCLIETLRWQPRSGFFLLERHLERLAASAAYFDFPYNRAGVIAALEQAARSFLPERQRVSLRLGLSGDLEVQATSFPCPGRRPWKVVLDDRPTDERDPFLCHKTSHRRVYEDARRRFPEADEVILWNRQGELTEGTITNLILEIDGQRLTPDQSCGLLPGVFRAELLARGRLHAARLPVEAWQSAERVFLINALRGIVRVR